MEDWKSVALGFVGGSLMPWLLNLFKAKTEADSSQFDILTKKYMELYDEVKAANDECEKKYKHLMEELFSIKSQIKNIS